MTTEKNKLYYGDNYEVLKMYVKDETVDLVYLDPPFNSRQDYNVLFAEKDGSQSSSQIHAFEDTWEWNIDAQRSYEYTVEQGGRVADALRASRILRCICLSFPKSQLAQQFIIPLSGRSRCSMFDLNYFRYYSLNIEPS